MMGNEFKVLALSGGGYRGLFTAQVLAQLEKATGKRIVDQFDLITGTSIGGIIALALADGKRPAEIAQLFKDKGKEIFPRCSFVPKWLWAIKGLNRSLYDARGLTDILNHWFANKQMQDLEHAFVMVPATRASTGSPKFFKTPHDGELFMDREIPVVDVALATSAAPVYFPMHKISADNTRYIDGGLVGNAPGLFGYIEAITRLKCDPEDVCVLSVGTLRGMPCISEKTSKRPWLWYWLNPLKPRLLDIMFSVQEQQTENMLTILMGDRYAKIDTPVSPEAVNDIGIDDASDNAQVALLSRANEEAGLFSRTSFFKDYLN
jgi:hypothetical protein